MTNENDDSWHAAAVAEGKAKLRAEARVRELEDFIRTLNKRGGLGEYLHSRMDALLSAQPAALSPDETLHEWATRLQPAAPTGLGTVTRVTPDFIEYECPGCHPTDDTKKCWRHQKFAAPSRTEAPLTDRERAVLDAMGEFKVEWIHDALTDAIETKRGLNPRVKAFVKVFEAELALRGLKP